MKKLFFIFIFCISIFIYTSCNPDNSQIYHGNNWIVQKLNDTILICIPARSAEVKPYIINLKTFTEYESCVE